MRWKFVPILALGLLAGCGKTTPPPPPPAQVYTQAVKAQSVVLRQQFSGRVSSFQSANVLARVSGALLERSYREGAEVRRGQSMFRIDPAFYQAQLDNDLGVLAQDRATLANATVTAGRNRTLLALGSVAQQVVDNSDAAERSAAAKVKADEAQVETARLNLGYTNVVAPIDGTSGQQQVTVGAVVGSGTSDSGAGGTLLTTIERIDPVYVNFTISAAELLALRQAQTAGQVQLAGQGKARVAIDLPDGSAYPHAGVLDFSGVLVSATTGAVNLRATLPNPAHVLLPGMYVTLNVDFGSRKGAWLVPQQALLRDPSGPYLLAVGEGGKVARRNVVVREAVGTDWIVTRGLADGEQIIVSGLQKASEGSVVAASAWQAPAQARPDASAAGR